MLLLLKSVGRVFEKCPENGLRLHIYKLASLKVETTPGHDNVKVFGVVLSIHARGEVCVNDQCRKNSSKTEKARMYIEETVDGSQNRWMH